MNINEIITFNEQKISGLTYIKELIIQSDINYFKKLKTIYPDPEHPVEVHFISTDSSLECNFEYSYITDQGLSLNLSFKSSVEKPKDNEIDKVYGFFRFEGLLKDMNNEEVPSKRNICTLNIVGNTINVSTLLSEKTDYKLVNYADFYKDQELVQIPDIEDIWHNFVDPWMPLWMRRMISCYYHSLLWLFGGKPPRHCKRWHFWVLNFVLFGVLSHKTVQSTKIDDAVIESSLTKDNF